VKTAGSVAINKTNERPGTRAQVRYVRLSPYKARQVLDLIRGETVPRAAEILQYTERRAADVIGKCLASAVANAINNDGQVLDELEVAACYADEGPTLKRWRPRARGRATRIRKRTCHITVIVGRMDDAKLDLNRAKESARAASGQGRARTASEARRRRVERSRGAEADDVTAAAAADAMIEADEALEAGGVAEEIQPLASAGDAVDGDATDAEATDAEAEAEADVAGAGDSGAEAAEDTAAAVADERFGAGSAVPLADGSGPEGYEIKGNAQSMLYHEPGSRYYAATKAEVYFATADDAERAGFSKPGSQDDDDADAAEENED
jgi:large subunit ribosomal protein L22